MQQIYFKARAHYPRIRAGRGKLTTTYVPTVDGLEVCGKSLRLERELQFSITHDYKWNDCDDGDQGGGDLGLCVVILAMQADSICKTQVH